MGITLLHEDLSANIPWTRTIFVLVVAFVAVVMPCEASGSIKVLLLFSVLAKPERGVKVKLAISVIVKNSKDRKAYPLITSSSHLSKD